MKRARGLAILLLGPLVCLILQGGPAEAGDNEPSGSASPNAAPPDDVQDLIFLGPTRPLLLRLHITIDGKPFRQVWQERFDELFALEDRDRDNRVSLEEAATIARDMNGGLRDSADGRLRDSASGGLKDLLTEGTVDRAALAAYIEKLLPPFAVRPRAVIAQGSALALFPLLDTDQDNRLSAAELDAAEAQLRQRDFDDDGAITGAELILDPNAIAAAADPAAAERRLSSDDSPVLAIIASTTAQQIAERLLAHYDRDRDGRLAAGAKESEISLPPSLLPGLDANGDQALDRAELGTFAERRPDLELNFAMGRAPARESRARDRTATQSGFRVRKKLNGGYELKLGEADVDFNRNNRDPQQTDLVELRTYDRDNNGYIDTAEASANNIGKSAFAAMDVDGDGKVFKGELTSFMTRQNAAAATRMQLEIKDLGQDLFTVLDTDLDGVLSSRELRSAKNILNTEDKNGDGALGGDEVPRRVEFELVRGVDERSETEARMTRRATRSTSQAATTGPLWFRKMDRNNDGDLDLREFVGPLSAFKKLDADGDGLVDRDEAAAAEKK